MEGRDDHDAGMGVEFAWKRQVVGCSARHAMLEQARGISRMTNFIAVIIANKVSHARPKNLFCFCRETATVAKHVVPPERLMPQACAALSAILIVYLVGDEGKESAAQKTTFCIRAAQVGDDAALCLRPLHPSHAHCFLSLQPATHMFSPFSFAPAPARFACLCFSNTSPSAPIEFGSTPLHLQLSACHDTRHFVLQAEERPALPLSNHNSHGQVSNWSPAESQQPSQAPGVAAFAPQTARESASAAGPAACCCQVCPVFCLACLSPAGTAVVRPLTSPAAP